MRFETDRLAVNDWTAWLSGPGRSALERDLAALLTPAVRAPLAPGAQDVSDGIAMWIERMAASAQVLRICLRDRDILIGLGFVMRAEPSAVHIGYLLGEPNWGQGFATELVHGLCDALGTEGIAALHAGVAADNPASGRVLEKCGFAQDAETGADTIHYTRILDPTNGGRPGASL